MRESLNRVYSEAGMVVCNRTRNLNARFSFFFRSMKVNQVSLYGVCLIKSRDFKVSYGNFRRRSLFVSEGFCTNGDFRNVSQYN